MRKQVLAVTIGVLLVLSVFSVLQFWQIKPAYAETGSFGSTTYGNDHSTINNTIAGSAFTSPDDSTADSISACFTMYGASITGKCMMYNASDDSLVGTTDEVIASPADFIFTTFNFTVKPTLVSGASYYLVLWTSTTVYFGCGYYPGQAVEKMLETYGSPPATFTHTTLYGNNVANIYCNYTVTPPAGPPTDSNIIIKRQKASTAATITCKWTALGEATLTNGVSIFCSNETGSYVNSSEVALSGSSAWGNQSITLSANDTVVSGWFYANDSLNQWATTDSITFQVFDNDMALHVEGNKMYDGNGARVIFKGLDYTYLMDTANGSWYDPETGDRFYSYTKTMEDGMNDTLDFIVASGGNHIRVIGTVEFWVDDTESYQTTIARFCELARERGIYFMFTFWRVNSTGGYITIPWDDLGNGYIVDAEDLADVWATVSDALKGFSNFVPEYWNEPPATEEWFDAVQLCLTYSRSVGIAGVVDVACAPDWGPLTYDFNPASGYTVGWQDLIPVALTYLNDTAFNLMFDLHAYWTNAYNSGNYGWYAYLYDDVVTWLNETECYTYSEDYVLNVGEIGYNNFASNLAFQQAWLNNTLSIFDDLGIGYQEWAGPPWANSGLSNQWGFITTSVNFTLTTAGEIWLDHLGGVTYADWLEGYVPPVVVTILSPTSTTYTSPTVPVEISASGGTINAIQWNCSFANSTVAYANQTYTVATSMTLANGDYVLYAMANNTNGGHGVETVTFTVSVFGGTTQNVVNVWWSGWW